MKILVYGAGVLGSYLAHVLIRGGNDVTLLARNERFKELKKNGLVIHHYIQCKTTIDKVKVIDSLSSDDVYEIIFVVMQYTHLNSILPYLSNNQSSNIIFVGNNADPNAIKNYMLKHSCNEKHIAFGFQSTGGRRENGKVICARIMGQMELGGLDGDLSWKNIIDKAFMNAKYKLTYFDDMDSWLKSHIALIMPLCYASYACNGNLHKVAKSKKLLTQIIKAIDEGYKVLESLGYSILPKNEENFVRNKSYIFYLLLKISMITPLGRLGISDHAMSAINEMLTLNDAFNILKQKSNIPTPNWDELQSHLEKIRNKETCIN